MPDETPSRAALHDRRHAETAVVAERAAVLVLLALLLYGVVRVLQPFAIAIAFGAFIAIGTWPARQALVDWGLRPGLAALAMLLLLVLGVALPTFFVAPDLADQIGSVTNAILAFLANLPDAPPASLAGLPLVGQPLTTAWARLQAAEGDVGRVLAPYRGTITGVLVDLGRAAAESVLQILLAIIVASFFWVSGANLVAQLRSSARLLGGDTGAEAIDLAGGAVRGVAWGVVGTGLLQGVLMTIGLAIAGIPSAATLGFVTMVFSISQVLGPLVVLTWAGAAIWLYMQGEIAWAIFMAVWGLVLVSSSDNVVRPLLIRRTVTMPLSLIIIGVFGGLVAFGFLGLFLGPTLLAVAHGLLRAWQKEGEDPPAEVSAGSP
jgi:predicted PurR-regulated permease PerM